MKLILNENYFEFNDKQLTKETTFISFRNRSCVITNKQYKNSMATVTVNDDEVAAMLAYIKNSESQQDSHETLASHN